MSQNLRGLVTAQLVEGARIGLIKQPSERPHI